ncbi:MAG: transglycosylase domain-containing protein [Chitinivibrionales bacterium]|nr:transglycosylase domain-containing protein [Chitinivibrionales bacterium]
MALTQKGSIRFIIIGVILACGVCTVAAYFIGEYAFNRYFSSWGDRLIELEKRGLLSRQFGAAWQDVVAGDAMEKTVSSDRNAESYTFDTGKVINGIRISDYPSLSIVGRLNEIRIYSNTIVITDRLGRKIASIKTDHTRAKIEDFPKTFITALLSAEDNRFYINKLGFEYRSFVRAVVSAGVSSIKSFSVTTPKGTSTITQQVAKLFISQLNEAGQRMVSRSLDRKVQELRLSAALRKTYPANAIFEVYLNHCIASDYGLIGVKDIAKGLFGKELADLNDAECVYIARMVKWGRNVHAKISRQCRIDMPRIAAALQWSQQKQQQVLREIEALTFEKPKQINTDYGQLIDLANEFWMKFYRTYYGADSVLCSTMDIIDPSSLLRRKGNMTLRMTIDLPLQQYLEKLVNGRGFGADTILFTDLRIGSYGEDVKRQKPPVDTVRMIKVIEKETKFSEARSSFQTQLNPGDTLVTNIRYFKKERGLWHRSVFHYTRRLTNVRGQYYAYVALDANSGKILAYYSQDELGSRLACLLKNKTPNGSSTAKPVVNALNFDLGNFQPYSKWSDSIPVYDEVPWKRYIIRKDGAPYEVVFEHSSLRGVGYRIHNHNYVFDGCQYIFDLLNASNNIFGVEAIYRLNRIIFDEAENVTPQAYPFAQFLYKVDAYDRIKSRFAGKMVTGVRLYKEMARIIGVDIDTMNSYGNRVGISDSLYSIALGTLEMTLLEQAHMFNVLHNNNLIEQPNQHPCLVIDSVTILGKPVSVAETDIIKRYHPFSDINTIRPTLLGLHKRLVSNAVDGLREYDIEYSDDLNGSPVSDMDTAYDFNKLLLEGPVANYAKSGTTDDVLRPFNVDVTSNKRTNYGLWNATVRIDLAKLSGAAQPDIHDVTIACIAECNEKYTGERDGKTLHKYVSRDLLKIAGIPCGEGFFSRYERYIRQSTPLSAFSCQEIDPSLATQPPAVSVDTTEDIGNIW